MGAVTNGKGNRGAKVGVSKGGDISPKIVK